MPAVGDDELFVFNQGADGGRVDFYIQQSVCARLQGDFVACGQGHGAQLGPKDAVVADGGGQQGNAAAVLGGEFTLVGDAAGGAVAGEGVVAVVEVGIGDVHRRCDEATDIDLAALAKHDAIRVDEPHLAVGVQLPVDVAGIAGGDAVQGDGAGVRLLEGDGCIFADVEAGPVDDGFLAALLDLHLAAGLVDVGAAGDDLAAGGQLVGCGRWC